jgi:hypothetical protein
VALSLAVAIAPGPAGADGTVACHCFRDRTWDPGRPAAADPYILATTRSSLLSAAFGVEKGSLVRAVMTGADPDDLWIAAWAGARSGRGAEALAEARAAKGSWGVALAGLPGLGAPFEGALARGAGAAELAALAVDDVLVTRLDAAPAAVAALRAGGAGTPETILATVLARRLGVPTAPLAAEVRRGRLSWGKVLADAGIEPKGLDAIVRRMVRP